ncbi:MAG: DUF2189 domain-containing protein [Paracoccaceae bacterium]
MVQTIGNPLSWGAALLGRAGSGLGANAQGLGSDGLVTPVVRRIGIPDIRAALAQGLDDFAALRTDVAAMCLLYPIVGAVLVWFALNQSLTMLVFPLVSGFALIGPVVAIGLYEMSKRRDAGKEVSWGDAFGVLANPSFGAILVLGLMLVGLFFFWLIAAWGIGRATMGDVTHLTAVEFLRATLTTGAGWAMILIGVPVGFVFAVAALAVSVVSFPMLIDRPVGLPVAVVTSVRVARENPVTVALWGLVVAVLLVAGSVPLLLGLAVVLPVLGHATWALYRRAVSFG